MTNNLLAIISMIFLSGVLSTSCNRSEKSPEMIRLDSLEAKLAMIAKDLNVDDQMVGARSAEMTENMKMIQLYYREEFTPELAQKMSRYRAIHKVYSKYLGKQEELNKELEDLHKQLRGLRNSVQDKKLSRDEFKKYYAEESKETDKLKEESARFAKVLYEVELDYQRLAPYVDGIVSALDSSNHVN